jgi:hypothetical protein
MTRDPDDGSAAAPTARFSAAYLREQRRKTRIGGWIGIVASLATIGDALAAICAHRMVDLGPARGHLLWPPSLVLLVGLTLLIGSGWILMSHRESGT